MASLFFAGALFRGEREITVEIGSLRRRCLSGREPAPFPTFPRPPGGVRLGAKRRTGAGCCRGQRGMWSVGLIRSTAVAPSRPRLCCGPAYLPLWRGYGKLTPERGEGICYCAR